MSEDKKSKGAKKSLMERIKEASTIEKSAILSESTVFGKKQMSPTSVPMINVALSGMVDGGLTPGLTMVAAPSRSFKSNFALLLAKAHMKKYPEGAILFYDSEFGTPESYFDSFDIDVDRVYHSPITNIEEIKFDIIQQLDAVGDSDNVLIIVDSIGNLASKKEVEDAREQNSAADMTRAKALKSLFRIITPHLTLKNIPCIVINSTYLSQEKYAKTIVSGGTGAVYSSDTIWTISRQKDIEGSGSEKELLGYNFVINIEKSRYIKEGSKIPITVSFEGGIKKWSGLVEEALESGYLSKPKVGWYAKTDPATGELLTKNYRMAEIVDDDAFWIDMFKTTDLAKFIKHKFTLSSTVMPVNDEIQILSGTCD